MDFLVELQFLLARKLESALGAPARLRSLMSREITIDRAPQSKPGATYRCVVVHAICT